jgi:hypothetical protein
MIALRRMATALHATLPHTPGGNTSATSKQPKQPTRDAVVVFRLKHESVEDKVDGLADEWAVNHELACSITRGSNERASKQARTGAVAAVGVNESIRV